MSLERHERIKAAIQPIADRLGIALLVAGDELEVGIHSDIRPLLESMHAEQVKTNSLLAALVEALADEGSDPEAEPTHYLDGTPVCL